MIGGFTINYGVVGVGYFGAELARFMNMHDNAKITCVYDCLLYTSPSPRD